MSDHSVWLRLAVGRLLNVRLRSVKTLLGLLTLFAFPHPRVWAAGVTLITHGFSGNVTDWIIPMAQKMPQYYRFLGTNFSCYEFYFTEDGQGNYVLSQSRIGGGLPTSAESGEIVVKLDWSQLAGGVFSGAPYSTTDIAPAFTSALLSTNFIPELGGKPLAQLPLHLIGHSRGGSMMCEITRLLGAQGVWVDHLTTLDPHPLNNDGFDDSLLTSTVDASARIYVNVLFADNYYQQNLSIFGSDPSGEPLNGAYNRYLSNLSGGYSQSHSDVHLWYHGTIDLDVPTTDTQANITASERQVWWAASETIGVHAGFYWSLIGRGNRLTTDEPAGSGTGQLRTGYNKVWDFGAGSEPFSRYALPANAGVWPSLIQFNLLSTNATPVGATNLMKFFYQYGLGTNIAATVQVFLDNDLNPLNVNAVEVYRQTVPGTGTNSVYSSNIHWVPNPANVVPGVYAIYAKISASGRSRYLYAPELLTLTPGFQAQLVVTRSSPNVVISWSESGSSGLVLQENSNPAVSNNWSPTPQIAVTNSGVIRMTVPAATGSKFYRLHPP